MVNSNYRDRRLTIADSCAWCAAPIALRFDRGEPAAIEPESAYLWGGGT